MTKETRQATLTDALATCLMMGLGACIGLGLHLQGVDTFLAGTLGAAGYLVLRSLAGIRQDLWKIVGYLPDFRPRSR